MSPTTTSAARPDATGLAAVETARAAAVEVAGADHVGEHLGATADGDRVVTHAFASTARGYVGWHWAVTVARVPRARQVTVSEVVLLPGSSAVLSPAWVPWSERLRPGDLGPGDLLPTPEDDPRLVPGYTGADADEATRDDLAAVAAELGLGRERVLSPEGRDEAADRWWAGPGGPEDPIAQAAPAPCATCGFAVRLGGPLAQAFAVCANEMSPSDGRVVTFDHGCGAHSSVRVPSPSAEGAEPVLDTIGHDVLPVEPARATAPVAPDPGDPLHPDEPVEPLEPPAEAPEPPAEALEPPAEPPEPPAEPLEPPAAPPVEPSEPTAG